MALPEPQHIPKRELHLNLLGQLSLQIHLLMPPSAPWGQKLSKPLAGRNGNPRPHTILPRTQDPRKQSDQEFVWSTVLT